MQELQEAVNNSVSKSTVCHMFCDMYKKKWRQLNHPEITPENAAQQQAWGERYRHYISEDWRHVKWTDECSVE
jgi:hypothetical protein